MCESVIARSRIPKCRKKCASVLFKPEEMMKLK